MQPGTQLGHYEILSALGKGGMGEVWRAKDTKLGRDVAIKTLPPEFSQDAERLARLEREARMLASLNHPNIAAIYGLEAVGDSRFLVLELVEGDTLADRLRSGAIPVDESLDLAVQVIAALEAAHKAHVIHRDLKPGNIKLRPDGTIKVLDFGLAKTTESSLPGDDEAPTVSMATGMTGSGAVLGTPAYMSPEQARGEVVDKRADIWAFGVVLFEMLTGLRAFPGNAGEALAGVIGSEPDWAALPDLPALSEAFLKRCLEKDSGRRIHDIADVRIVLSGDLEVSELSDATAAQSSQSFWQTRRARMVFGLVGLAMGAGVGAYWLPPRISDPPLEMRQATFRRGNVNTAEFDPDGGSIIYGAAWDGEPYRLFQTRLDSFQAREIAGLPPADLLSVSDDGELAISMSRPAVDGYESLGELGIVDLGGGAPRVELDDIVDADWFPDGELAAVVRRVDNRSQLEFPVGSVVANGNIISSVRVSPDGSRACFAVEYGTLMLAERGGSVRVLADGVSRVTDCAWTPDNREVWFTWSPGGSTNGTVEAIELETERRRIVDSIPAFASIQDISSDGTLLLSVGSMRFATYAWDATIERERELTVFDASRVRFLDARGTTLLLFDASSGSMVDGTLWLRSTDGSAPIQFPTFAPALALTPDGEAIAVIGDGQMNSFVSQLSNQITMIPTGAGAAETIDLPVEIRHNTGNQLGTNEWATRHPEFSDDGRRLLLPWAREPGREPRVWIHDFSENGTWSVTPEGVTGPAILSPDGRFVASNQPEGLFVYDVDSGAEPFEVPGGSDPGQLMRWTEDPDIVFVAEYDGTGARLIERNIRTGTRREVREIRAADPAGVSRFDLHVSRSGQAYAYLVDRILTNLFVIPDAY